MIWKREAVMSFFLRHRIVVTGIVLSLFALFAAAPYAPAQTRVIERILQWGAGGSYLGIQMDDVTSGNMSQYKLDSERGVIIRSVVKGSPAEAANLKENDVLLEYAGTPVWSASQLTRLVQETPPGRKVELVVSRDGKHLKLTAQIGKRDDRDAGYRSQAAPPDLPMDRFFEFLPEAPQRRPAVRAENRPRLGVTLQPLTDQLGKFLGVPGKKGALIASVESGSPSAGKLKSGDVVTSADGKSIETPEDLSRAVREKTGGTMVLKVIRDKKEITVSIDLPREEGEGKGLKL
jgi:S1-C subfamily serine protease